MLVSAPDIAAVGLFALHRKRYFVADALLFLDGELLFRAVRAVLSLGSTDELWAEILRLGDRHYLVTEEYGKGDESSDLLLLSEFGTRLTADSVIYLREHAETVSVGNIGRLLRTD